jgi:hypothetical protein
MSTDGTDPLPDDLPPLPTDPDPGPTPGPTTTTTTTGVVTTIGEAIESRLAAAASLQAAHDAAAKADQALVDAQAADDSESVALKADLAALPERAAFSPDGKSVYVADGSATGYHVLTPADPSTPLQTTPATG